MPKLYNQNTGDLIGEINDAQLQFLIDQLEEEGSEDRDYFINNDTLSMFQDAGADPALIKLLSDAMGDDGEIDIEWR